MSDYLYSLESHLNAAQNRIVSALQNLATVAGVNLYLAGGAMRDLLGGFPTRDLDFVLEAPPERIAADLAAKLGGQILTQDQRRQSIEIIFPGGVTAELAASRDPRLGSSPIREDLARRDFTVNAIALKLNRGSKGLLIDPTNGVADLERKELRTPYSAAFQDDPVRLLRAVRLKHRLQFAIEERTQRQFDSAVAERLHAAIQPPALLQELKLMGDEPSPAELVRVLETIGLLALFFPPITGGKANHAGLAKLEKLKKSVPLPTSSWREGWRSFFLVLTEQASPKEKAALTAALGIAKEDLESCKKLQAAAAKLELALKSPNLRKPSQIYELLVSATADLVLLVLYQSAQRLVQDRIRNYVQKYSPLVQEIPESDFEAEGIVPGVLKYEKARAAFIAARLNARPKKADENFVEVPADPVPAPRGRTAGRAKSFPD